MKQFKELSIDEQLELVKHVLEGGKLEVFCAGDWLFDNEQEGGCITFHESDIYRKLPNALQVLYKERQDIQSKIDAELKRLGEPVTRDNTSPVQPPSEQDKSSESRSMERITLENWKSLGIKVGDKVKVVEVEDEWFDTEIGKCSDITNMEEEDYVHEMFLEIDGMYLTYNTGDEIYLIRTEEGSLG